MPVCVLADRRGALSADSDIAVLDDAGVRAGIGEGRSVSDRLKTQLGPYQELHFLDLGGRAERNREIHMQHVTGR